MTRTVTKCHLQWHFPDLRKLRQEWILDPRSAHQRGCTESRCYVITCPPAVPVALPDPSRTSGRKTYARHHEKELLVATYGKSRVQNRKGLSRRRLKQAL